MKKPLTFIILSISLLISAFLFIFLQNKFFVPSAGNTNDGRIPLIISTKNNRQIKFLVEIADTFSERGRGLMFRKSLDKNSGMLFIFEEPQLLSFYMKNTYLPLDIIFIDNQNNIVDINKNVPALQETPLINSSRPCKYALEIPAGSADSFGISAGDKIIQEN